MTAAPASLRTKARSRAVDKHKPQSLAATVRRSAIWNIATTILLRLANIGVTAIAARLLTPHDFGVFAVATTVFTIVSAIGEFGIPACLVRADLDVDALGPTLTSVSLGTSLAAASVMFVLAEPISASLGSRDGAGPVRVMALVVLLWGVSSVPMAQCVRDFKQDKLFLANGLAFFPSTVVLLLLAKHGNGAMAFAWSRVVGQAISCAVMILSAPKLYLPGMARSALRVLREFGIPVACANFIGYILQNVDYAFIGHLMGPIMLGTYVLAFNVSSWSSTLLAGVINSVSAPAFSRVKSDRARLMDAIAKGVRVVTLIAAPMCSLVMVLARPLVLALYGSRWVAAAPVLAILSLYGLISIVGLLFSSMLAALGRSKSMLVVQLLWLAALVPAMAIGVHEDRIVGAAIAHVLIIGPLVLPCYLIALKRATGVRIGLIAKAALPPLAAAAVAASLASLVASRFERPILQLILGGMTGGLSYLVMTAPQLILLLGRKWTAHPGVERVLYAYYTVSRALRIPMVPPLRPAGRGSRHVGSAYLTHSDRPAPSRDTDRHRASQLAGLDALKALANVQSPPVTLAGMPHLNGRRAPSRDRTSGAPRPVIYPRDPQRGPDSYSGLDRRDPPWRSNDQIGRNPGRR